MVNGVLYSTAGTRRSVVALDAATGELLWVHSENEGKRGSAAPRQLSGRGLAYWTDGKQERILYVTPGYRLMALNAKTGAPVPSFGANGVVDLKQDDDQDIDPITGEVGLHSTPIVAGNVVIIGAAHKSGGVPKSMRNVKGYVRGFDVRTGKRLWIFHTIPKPGEYGFDTWEKDSWSYTGNTGVWAQISVDEDLGIVYLPVELPTGDYYGGHRPGANLFSAKAWSRSISRPASASGITNWCTTACGTWIFRARRSSPISWSTAAPSKPSRSPPSRRFSTSSTASPANPSGLSKSARFPKATFPANGIRPLSRFPPSLRPMIARASRSTI